MADRSQIPMTNAKPLHGRRHPARTVHAGFEGDGKVRGTGYSYVVTLKLQEKDGAKTRDKKIAYRVVTEPKQVITREDR